MVVKNSVIKSKGEISLYIPLVTRSAYSLLKSTIRIHDYVQNAHELGYTHLGICDVDTVHGLIEFQQACQKVNITPIFGVSLQYTSQVTKEEYQIHAFATNEKSYRELLMLSSYKMTNETWDAQLDLDHLTLIIEEKNEWFDCIAQGQDPNQALIGPAFDSSRLFIGIMPKHNSSKDDVFYSMIQKTTIRPIAVEPLTSLSSQEALTLRVLEAIATGEKLASTTIIEKQAELSASLRSPSEMEQLFNFYPEALENSHYFTKEHYIIPMEQAYLPKYPLEKQTAAQKLKELCDQGMQFRKVHNQKQYEERLAYELDVIHKMGFDDYFLIVWDVMDFAHRKNIVTGAGRGSAAGSLVSYLLRITEVDPIEYRLLFERFLNPERYSMPDIDLDIPDNHREEILLYVKEKYGADYVAQIATFGTMAAKMALRDVGRVFGLSQSEANRWSNALPNRLKITLTQGYQESKAFRDLVDMSERNQLLYQVACAVEGLPRHVSTHAAGVLISDRRLWEIVPLQMGNNSIYLTQWTMYAVEAIGLLKMDFLGLRNLSIIDDTLRGVEYLTGKPFTQEMIPLQDEATYSLFQKGDTAGIFQFESSGIRQVLQKLGPETLEDLAAVNALYRPGPMQMIDTFIARKKGKEEIVYPDPALQPILQPTYGVMVYQEQIMQVASTLAGYTLGQADLLRRAIGKKNRAILETEREHFYQGANKNGISAHTAKVVYEYIERFADYRFNRSHAFAYSIIGYQMAFLKVHYPLAFFKALMQSVQHQPKKVREYANEAKRYHIHLLSPAINSSYTTFSLVNPASIRFGLGGIKGIRRDFVQAVLDERKARGKFTSFDEFLLRMQSTHARFLKEELLRPMIQIGVFDEVVQNRHQAVEELPGRLQNLEFSAGSLELLQMMPLKVTQVEEYTPEECLAFEEEYLGLYLSGHPLDRFDKLRKPFHVESMVDLIEGNYVKILGAIKTSREIRTKKGEKMAFLDMVDQTAELSVTVFPELYRTKRTILEQDGIYLIEGKVERSTFNQQLQLIARKIERAEDLLATFTKESCFLRITHATNDPELLQHLAEVLEQFHGKTPVIMYYEVQKQQKILEERFWINPSTEALTKIKELLGNENVVFN